MRYSDKPLVGLIKECKTTLRAKNANRLIDDDAIAERRTSILCSIESRPAGQQKYIGGMTVLSLRRVAAVKMQKSDLRMNGREKGEGLVVGKNSLPNNFQNIGFPSPSRSLPTSPKTSPTDFIIVSPS